MSARVARWIAAAGVTFAAAVGPIACGDDDSGSAGDLVSACQKYCAAQAAAGCKKGLPEDSCKSQCAAAPTALGDVCVKEYTDAFDCISGFKFTCQMDVPVPQAAGCLAEVQALEACQKKAPCDSFCKAAAAAGCPPGGTESACVDTCRAEIDKDERCGLELGSVRTCEGKETLKCVGGKPVTDLCNSEKRSYASCLSFPDTCPGYCWLADDAGCAGGTWNECTAACEKDRAAVPSCQFQFDDVRQCGMDRGITCSGGKATTPECASQQQSYDTCVKSHSM